MSEPLHHCVALSHLVIGGDLSSLETAKCRQCWSGQVLHCELGSMVPGGNANPDYGVPSAPSPSPRSNHLTCCLGASPAGAVCAEVKCRSSFVLQFKELKEQGAGRDIYLTSHHALPPPTSPARAQGHITPATEGQEELCRPWNLN